MRPNVFPNSAPRLGSRTSGSPGIGKVLQLPRPCSTISKDNTAGDRARDAALLAEFGQKKKQLDMLSNPESFSHGQNGAGPLQAVAMPQMPQQMTLMIINGQPMNLNAA
ncbi:hypothetical protein F5884DRAFT_859064 [Xylogone sp. PMI_703]|nr:hypothetical protein F5884DRAFT_859064 [Xylogone sp. PMI_703]